MNRAQLQEQIDKFRKGQDIKLLDLTPLMDKFLDTKDLTYEGMSQEFLKQQILADLSSYEGVLE